MQQLLLVLLLALQAHRFANAGQLLATLIWLVGLLLPMLHHLVLWLLAARAIVPCFACVLSFRAR